MKGKIAAGSKSQSGAQGEIRQLEHIGEIEKRLWKGADTLRPAGQSLGVAAGV